jgi:hypothetical protein
MKIKILLLVNLMFTFFRVFGQTEDAPPIETYSEDAIKKAQNLATYIQLICNGSRLEEQRLRSIALAVKLFTEPNTDCRIQTQVEMKKGTKKIINYKIPEYFEMLYQLQYEKVVIEWYNVAFASNLSLGSDGNYHGRICIKQKFIGTTKDGRIDGVENVKCIHVILKRMEIDAATNKVEWQIKFCDMGVKQD